MRLFLIVFQFLFVTMLLFIKDIIFILVLQYTDLVVTVV